MADTKEREIVAMSFSMIVDPKLPKAGHQAFRTEGFLNTGLEEHLKTCAECRRIIATYLRDFAAQIEGMR